MEIKGTYNSAKIFTDVIDEKAIEQLQALCNFAPLTKSKIRVMPDVHAGKGCTIGTTMTIIDKVIPNMVGVDIGCGMDVVELVERDINFADLDNIIYSRVPSGRNCRSTMHPFAEQIDLTELRCLNHIDINRAKLSIGSLGGGNHFIEVDRDDDGNLYIVIHSGSRHLGKEVAEYYQHLAYTTLTQKIANDRAQLLNTLKQDGRHAEINDALENFDQNTKFITEEMAYLEGQNFEDYIHDMKIVQQFAVLNRKAMLDEIMKGLGVTPKDSFTCIHNYIDTENMIMRKGSVSAQKGEKILIPINMRDGSLICLGKGNPDWNYSAPHGAGRLLSRTQAREKLSMETFRNEMQGIYSTSISPSTLDESPMAYKNKDDIVKNIEPTAEIIKQIKPVYNFKAGE